MEAAGGTWRLIYLNVDVAELRRRLRERNSRFDANAAFPITDELLDKYLDSFEEPQGEGEELVQHGGDRLPIRSTITAGSTTMRYMTGHGNPWQQITS